MDSKRFSRKNGPVVQRETASGSATKSPQVSLPVEQGGDLGWSRATSGTQVPFYEENKHHGHRVLESDMLNGKLTMVALGTLRDTETALKS